METTNRPAVRLAVRECAGFLLQSGSIDNRFGGADRGPIGTRIHRQLQRQETGYRAEITLSECIEHNGIEYQLHGRADGLVEEDGLVTVDEIKTTGYPMELVTENFNQAHWGQAMLYAYIWAVQNNLPEIGLRLTYYQVDTGEIKRFRRRASLDGPDGLREFVQDLLGRYQLWAELQSDWKETRTSSVKALAFPFPQYRGGQRKLAAAVYRTVESKGRLFCQAPTGIGKTMSTLFPAIKAMGEGMGERIFYLTAKTITRQAAVEALARMREQGLRLKSVTLTAKDKICFQSERTCNPDECPFADGYYDRMHDALYELLRSKDGMTREVIEECARRNRLCPFELSLDLTLWCDAIICDYNYLFDPVVYLKRMFSEEGGDFIFLVDEAHNLVDRAREMYTARLRKSTVMELKRKCSPKAGNVRSIYRALDRLNQAFLERRKACEERERETLVEKLPPTEFGEAILRFTAACDEWLPENKSSPLREDVLNFYFEALFYQKILELFDTHFAAFTALNDKDVELSLLCLDPSELLDGCMKRGRSAVLFSATLSPVDYFISVLGGGEDARSCALQSPFDPARMCLLVADRVSTKYRDREDSVGAVAELLHTMVAGRAGNYMAYFPSYKYMHDILEEFQQAYPEITVLAQSGGMDEAARERFLERFDAANEGTLLGFCVLGGIYSEGIDLRGDRLIGTAVVGVGLPQINAEQEILRSYYDNTRGEGFAFAYRYPGMNKVEQAAGRVIRSEQDRGVVLLIDSRFTTQEYRRLFPAHWSGFRAVRSPQALEYQLAEFWKQFPIQ